MSLSPCFGVYSCIYLFIFFPSLYQFQLFIYFSNYDFLIITKRLKFVERGRWVIVLKISHLSTKMAGISRGKQSVGPSPTEQMKRIFQAYNRLMHEMLEMVVPFLPTDPDTILDAVCCADVFPRALPNYIFYFIL